MIRIKEEKERIENERNEIEKLMDAGFSHAEIVSHLLVKSHLINMLLQVDNHFDYCVENEIKEGVVKSSRIQDQLTYIQDHIGTLENKIAEFKKQLDTKK